MQFKIYEEDDLTLCVLNKRNKKPQKDARKILEVMDIDMFSTLVVVIVSWMVYAYAKFTRMYIINVHVIFCISIIPK